MEGHSNKINVSIKYVFGFEVLLAVKTFLKRKKKKHFGWPFFSVWLNCTAFILEVRTHEKEWEKQNEFF